MDNDDLFGNVKSPYDRIDELEIFCTSMGLALQEMAGHVKSHSELGVKVSDSLLNLVSLLDILGNKVSELESKIKHMENNQ